MIDDSIDGLPLELLAAYVDDELDPSLRKRVEQWLTEHPDSAAELLDQESLSRSNEEYWQTVTPPQPDRDTWDRTLNRIESALTPVASPVSGRGRRLSYFVAGAASASIAAAVLISIWAVNRVQPGGLPQQITAAVTVPVAVTVPEDEEDFVFHVARAEDVELIRVPEDAADLLVVGKHPLADDPLVLVTSSDFQVLNYGLDDQGEVPDYQTMIGSSTPMFVAPTRKK